MTYAIKVMQLLSIWLSCTVGLVGLFQYAFGNKNGVNLFFKCLFVFIAVHAIPFMLSIIHVGVARMF